MDETLWPKTFEGPKFEIFIVIKTFLSHKYL